MIVTVAMLRAAGLSEAQIICVVEMVDKEDIAGQRERWRIQKQNQRLRPQMSALSAAPPLLRRSNNTKPKKEARKKPTLIPLPDDWQPKGPQRDPTEPDEFRNKARAKGWMYANWDAAYRNYQDHPEYNHRNKNGGQSTADLAAGQAEWERYREEQRKEQLGGKGHQTRIRPDPGMGQARPDDQGQLRSEGGRVHGQTVESGKVIDAVFAVARNLRA
jgi:hypothetical protein